MTTEEFARAIARWVVQNAQGESIFLTPNPSYMVNARDLLDEVARLAGVTQATLGAEVDKALAEKKR